MLRANEFAEVDAGMMAPAGISRHEGETAMWIRRAAFGALVSAVLAAGVAPVVHAEPSGDADSAYLAAMNHGKLCCPDQPDTPINVGGPDNQIQVGRSAAEYMTAYPTLRAFHDVQKLNQQKLGLDPLDAGELVVIAMRFYASPSVESQVRAQMGPEADQWYGNEG
jgi:hypothetical protein